MRHIPVRLSDHVYSPDDCAAAPAAAAAASSAPATASAADAAAFKLLLLHILDRYWRGHPVKLRDHNPCVFDLENRNLWCPGIVLPERHISRYLIRWTIHSCTVVVVIGRRWSEQWPAHVRQHAVLIL